MTVILGINALHAGAAAALLVDGKPVLAIAEERLNRVKHYAAFPKLAVQRCLDAAGIGWDEVDFVALGRDPAANRARKLRYALTHPRQLPNLLRIRGARSALGGVREVIARECEVDPQKLNFEILDVEHHLAHTASAYFASPWERAAGITIDGSGDFVSCMLSRCEGDRIEPLQRIFVPDSLGTLYTAICSFIGYDRYGDEGKVMGLAPLGRDVYREDFEAMAHATPTGFALDPDWFPPFGANAGVRIDARGEMVVDRLFAPRLLERFGPPRARDAAITPRDEDLAFGLQARFQQLYLHLLRRLHTLVPETRLVLAGGCALNSVANGLIFAETPFAQTCIQPAAGDDGLALGAALHASRALLGDGERWVMRDARLGTEYSEAVMRRELDARGVAHERLDETPLLERCARAIADGAVLGWFQGRMEWGPRALGSRSILAHPGHPEMKAILNARIKQREPFRPFAPAVLAERQHELFERSEPSPFMLHVYRIRPEWQPRLCAVTHVDGTGRLQSVSRDENPLFHALIARFEQQSGLPVLLNTSFNENEPIVEHPAQAIDCFLRTKMDALALGPFFCRKAAPESRA